MLKAKVIKENVSFNKIKLSFPLRSLYKKIYLIDMAYPPINPKAGFEIGIEFFEE